MEESKTAWSQEILDEGYVLCPRRLFEQRDLTHGQMALLLFLGGFGKEIYPSSTYMARVFGVSGQQINKWLLDLERRGFISRRIVETAQGHRLKWISLEPLNRKLLEDKSRRKMLQLCYNVTHNRKSGMNAKIDWIEKLPAEKRVKEKQKAQACMQAGTCSPGPAPQVKCYFCEKYPTLKTKEGTPDDRS